MTSVIRSSDNFDSTPAKACVRLNTQIGYGSTSTKIPRFSGIAQNQGSDISYADSAILGSSFTINVSGVYAISYSDNLGSNAVIGISLNSAQLTTNLRDITAANRLCAAMCYPASVAATVAVTLPLSAGDVIRPHADGTAVNAAAISHFTITRVA